MEIALLRGDETSIGRLLRVLESSFADMSQLPTALEVIEPVESKVILMRDFLSQWKEHLLKESGRVAAEKDQVLADLIATMSSPDNLVEIKQNHHNEAVADLVLNRNEMKKIVEYDGKLIRKDAPVFQIPGSSIGRSQFFAAVKIVGNVKIDTILFNILVLWLMTLFFYLALVNDWLRKILAMFRNGKREG